MDIQFDFIFNPLLINLKILTVHLALNYSPPKSHGVRKASVLALQNLYEVNDNVPSLGLFTERFYKRMIELADDVDISVAVCAIGLVKQLIR